MSAALILLISGYLFFGGVGCAALYTSLMSNRKERTND